MKIVIVGANGQVGKELCLIFGRLGHEVTAIVRNPYGAAFFRRQDVPYVIGDVTVSDAADSVLKKADVVVIAAVFRGELKIAAEVNKSILSSCINKADSRACVVYFSSIRVFSRKIDRNFRWWDPLPTYDKEKQLSERFFQRACKEREIRGSVFRLGHVVGLYQEKTARFVDAARVSGRLRVDPAAPSNIVHTVTICDAILAVAQREEPFQVATVVDRPQWSWKRVFEDIDSSGGVKFSPSPRRRTAGWPKQMLRYGLLMAKPAKQWLIKVKPYLGQSIRTTLDMEGGRAEFLAEIEDLEGRPVELSEFAYKPAPGPFLEGLQETSVLLNNTAGYGLDPLHE
jgi:dTDP-4-dehydrorhamnose reductase